MKMDPLFYAIVLSLSGCALTNCGVFFDQPPLIEAGAACLVAAAYATARITI